MQTFKTIESIQTRISYDAITCASLCTDGNIVTEIKTSSGVRLIQAFSPSLQPEWGLKCMTLNQLVKDHQTRMILGKEFELQLERGPADSRGKGVVIQRSGF